MSKKKAKDIEELRTQRNNEYDVATDTLKGDVRDFLLDNLKHIGKPWQQMGELEQEEQIDRATRAAETFVRKCVVTVAAKDQASMIGTLDSVTVKDGFKAVIKLSKTDKSRHELVDAQGQTVLIVVADAEQFSGEREPAKADPDQQDFGLDEEEENDA